MAGWHLSPNKALFFGGAVFISLALLIHPAPHFPSSMDLAAFHSSSSSDASTSCLALLHAVVVWTGSDGGAVPSSWRWASKPTNPCSFRILPPSDSSFLLNEAWIVVSGDSQARLLSLSLISLLTTAPRRTSPSGPACSSATPTTTSPFPPTVPRSTSSELPTLPTSPRILPLCAPGGPPRPHLRPLAHAPLLRRVGLRPISPRPPQRALLAAALSPGFGGGRGRSPGGGSAAYIMDGDAGARYLHAQHRGEEAADGSGDVGGL